MKEAVAESGRGLSPVESNRCVVCHLTLQPEDGGLCEADQYDEQAPAGRSSTTGLHDRKHLNEGSCECECSRCFRPNVRSGACICPDCTDEWHDHDDRPEPSADARETS
jgi:hypothetical protein